MKRIARWILAWLQRWARKPDVRDVVSENRVLQRLLSEHVAHSEESRQKREYWDRIGELLEARRMAGSGPWTVPQSVLDETDRLIQFAAARISEPGAGVRVRETAPVVSAGSTGDIELALQNVEWRREVNLSWLEFSRWGIQQMILISRLWYVKNPFIQRGINVTANYVFGRGVEVMSDDDDANATLQEFFERNKRVLGQAALSDLHKRLQYDGQVFYAFFSDEVDTGEVTVRTIDATEICEIITDPDDTDKHQFYRRKWTARVFNEQTGQVSTQQDQEAYYPALNYEPADRPAQINGKPVMWNSPVLMQKGGVGIGKWHFDTPKAYAALDWARNARRLLEADLDTRISLSQIAMTLTTKGGQQALQGAKQQLMTAVGPTSNLWDQNPPATSSSIFASGPGTTLAAFDTRGAIRNPSDVKEYRAMVAIVFEIPPTFLGDLETANLATATTLDRPTELAMLEKQERWRETLIEIATYVLKVSKGAASGRLREARKEKVRIVECARKQLPNGRWVYEKAKPKAGTIQVKCIFPAIREGDMAVNVKAIVEAMTLDNKGGQVVGIDEKAGVMRLAEELGLEDYGEVLDEQYPKSYDPDRTKEPLPAPIGRAEPDPGGRPQLPGGKDPQPVDKTLA